MRPAEPHATVGVQNASAGLWLRVGSGQEEEALDELSGAIGSAPRILVRQGDEWQFRDRQPLRARLLWPRGTNSLSRVVDEVLDSGVNSVPAWIVGANPAGTGESWGSGRALTLTACQPVFCVDAVEVVAAWGNRESTFRRALTLHRACRALAEELGDGAPLWRRVFVHYPSEAKAWRCSGQWLLGPSVLAVTIFDSASSVRTAWIPPGEWVPVSRRGRSETGPATRIVEVSPSSLALYERRERGFRSVDTSHPISISDPTAHPSARLPASCPGPAAAAIVSAPEPGWAAIVSAPGPGCPPRGLVGRPRGRAGWRGAFGGSAARRRPVRRAEARRRTQNRPRWRPILFSQLRADRPRPHSPVTSSAGEPRRGGG